MNLDAEVIVKFKIKNLTDTEHVQSYALDNIISEERAFELITKEAIFEEGLFGIVEDDHKILHINRL